MEVCVRAVPAVDPGHSPADLFRQGARVLARGRGDAAQPVLVRSLLGFEAPVGANVLHAIQCQGGDEPCWITALAAARCGTEGAELAHQLLHGRGTGHEATRVAVHGRLAQIELLLQLGDLVEADRVLDQAFQLMRDVDDDDMKASLWWTAANVARSHGRSPTAALAMRRARASGALGAYDGPELLLSFAEACVEAGWQKQAIDALRELDGMTLTRRHIGRIYGLRGALVLDKDVAAAWTSWGKAERRLRKAEAWKDLAELKLRMAAAACDHGGVDPLPILAEVLEDRYVQALPAVPRRVVAIVARLAAKHDAHDLALLAEIEGERLNPDVEACRQRQVEHLEAMGFHAEAAALNEAVHPRGVPRLPGGSSTPPPADDPRGVEGRDAVARGVRVRRHLQTESFRTAAGVRALLDRLVTATRTASRAHRR